MPQETIDATVRLNLSPGASGSFGKGQQTTLFRLYIKVLNLNKALNLSLHIICLSGTYSQQYSIIICIQLVRANVTDLQEGFNDRSLW